LPPPTRVKQAKEKDKEGKQAKSIE